MGEINPDGESRSSIGRARAGDSERHLPYVIWGVVFGLNLIVPSLLGLMMTTNHGRLGMLAAIALLLMIGLYTCWFGREVADPLNLGAGLVAIAQVFPILQMIAGFIGMAVSGSLGQVADDDGQPLGIISDFGGFVATLVTGGVLMGVSLGLGSAIRSLAQMMRHDQSSTGETPQF